MHDYSVKFEASQVDIDCEDQNLLDRYYYWLSTKRLHLFNL